MGVNLAGLKMKVPVTVASGTFGFGLEFADLVDLNKLGAVTTKTLTIKPRKGNPQPRLVEIENGMVNSIGLQNDGIEYFLKNYLPKLRKYDTSIIVNIAGETIEEYALAVKALKGIPGIHAIEANISCPNVEKGCMLFGKDPALTKEVISLLRKGTDLPLIAKLTPNVDDIVPIAKAAVEAGADIISMINTIQTTVNVPGGDKTLTAGMSGPVIKKTALKLISRVRKALPTTPVIGMGGIMCTADAKEFMSAGATAVAVGTANFIDPRIVIRICGEL